MVAWTSTWSRAWQSECPPPPAQVSGPRAGALGPTQPKTHNQTVWKGQALGLMYHPWQLSLYPQAPQGCDPPDSHSSGAQLLLPLHLVLLAPGTWAEGLGLPTARQSLRVASRVFSLLGSRPGPLPLVGKCAGPLVHSRQWSPGTRAQRETTTPTGAAADEKVIASLTVAVGCWVLVGSVTLCGPMPGAVRA